MCTGRLIMLGVPCVCAKRAERIAVWVLCFCWKMSAGIRVCELLAVCDYRRSVPAHGVGESAVGRRAGWHEGAIGDDRGRLFHPPGYVENIAREVVDMENELPTHTREDARHTVDGSSRKSPGSARSFAVSIPNYLLLFHGTSLRSFVSFYRFGLLVGI